MSLLFPRFAYAPVRCGPVRHEVAPLFSLFDDTLDELQRASRKARKSYNPKFDLKETKDAYQLEGELPGVDQNNLSIEFTDEHTLTIKGRSERYSESGRRPETPAVEAEQKDTIEETPASETSSVKSHQATVEDEEPANASADAATTASEVAAPAPTPASVPAKSERPKAPENQYWITEREVGEFTRSFSFPARVNQDAVKASLKNGLLSIVIPKAPAPQSRRISIE